MSQVFISYASADRTHAQRLARALQREGLSVWWDRELVAGEHFDQAIEQALDAAGCAVVLWSGAAVQSQWVRAEASRAAQREALVPAWLEPARLPLEFSRRHTVDLAGWQGEAEHEGFQALLRAVRRQLEGPAAVDVPLRDSGMAAAGPASSAAARRAFPWVWTLSLLGLGLAAAGWWVARPLPAPSASSAPATGVASAASPAAVAPTGAAEPAPAAATSAFGDAAEDAPALMAQAEGVYVGDIVSDSRGSSAAGVQVRWRALGGSRVELSSQHPRIGTLQLELTHAGGHLTQAPTLTDGSTLLWSREQGRATLTLNVRGELSYAGVRR
ncbi:MAG: toll/interleukin-1 receptor domain-containing protein [Rubrivivax sp.]|nr:toll/interleukin-1 receptor domain-containing protein [Rubrivivax sp.]